MQELCHPVVAAADNAVTDQLPRVCREESGSGELVAAAPLELVVLVREEDVEAGGEP
jgi:hypothetical protein